MKIGDRVRLTLDEKTLRIGSYRALKDTWRNNRTSGIIVYMPQDKTSAGIELNGECNRPDGFSIVMNNTGNAFGRGKNGSCIYADPALLRVVETKEQIENKKLQKAQSGECIIQKWLNEPMNQPIFTLPQTTPKSDWLVAAGWLSKVQAEEVRKLPKSPGSDQDKYRQAQKTIRLASACGMSEDKVMQMANEFGWMFMDGVNPYQPESKLIEPIFINPVQELCSDLHTTMAGKPFSTSRINGLNTISQRYNAMIESAGTNSVEQCSAGLHVGSNSALNMYMAADIDPYKYIINPIPIKMELESFQLNLPCPI